MRRNKAKARPSGNGRTKDQLLREAARLRRRLTGLEAAEAERKQADKREDMLAHAVRSISECVCITDMSDKILFVNEAFLKTYGFDEDELLGKHISLVRSENNPPEFIQEILPSTLRGGWKGEILNRRKDGSEFPIFLSSTVVRDEMGRPVALIGVTTDITERKRGEEALRESEEKFRSLAEQSPNMIFINKKGRILYANRRCEEIMGYGREEFYSPKFNFLDMIASESVDLVQESLRKHFSGEEVAPYEYTLVTRERKKIEAIITTKLITYEGESAILGIVTDITERKSAEQALQESETLYRVLFNSAQIGLGIAETDGTLTTYNDAMLRPGGYTRDDIGKIGNVTHLYCDPGQREEMLAIAEKEGFLPRHEVRFKRKDGTCYDALLSLIRIKIKGRDCWQAMVEDITERKLAERELLRRAQELEALDEVNSALNESIELEDILSSALKRIVSSQRYDLGAIFVTKGDGKALRLSATAGYSTKVKHSFGELNLLEGITGLVGRTKQLVALELEDYPSYLPHKSLFESEHIFSNSFVPLLSKGNIVGVLHVGRKVSSTKSDSDVRFLNAVANQLGVSIESAQLYQRVKLSEERYRSVLESISDVVYKASSDGETLFISPNVERLVGYRPTDFYQRKGLWLSLIFPEDRHSVEELMRQPTVDSQPRSVEYRVLPRGKAVYIWIRDSMTSTTDGRGNTVEHYGIISDVTERKKLEREIRESEQTLRKVVDSMGDALVVTDLRGIVREVNQEFERMTGYRRSEAVGQEFPYKWAHEDELSRLVEWVDALREKGFLHDFDMTMINKKGELVSTSLNTTLLRNEVGDPIAMLSIARDITERKRLTEEIRHRTRQIELINRIISTANQSMNFDEIFATIVMEVREFVPFDEINVALLHAARKTLELYAVESSLPHETSAQGTLIPLSKTISRYAVKKGKAVVVPDLSRYPQSASYLEGLRSQISIPFYSKGEVLGTFNVASLTTGAYSGKEVQILQPIANEIGGIVDRIRLFEKVSHDATYIHNLLDSMDNVVYTVDRESKVQEVNKAWKEFALRSGMPELADERSVHGKHILDTVQDSALRESYQAIIHDVLAGNSPYYSEEFTQKGPGEERVYQMRVNPMLINDRITGLVFTNTDITEIKRTEAALRRRNEELLGLNEVATLVSTSLNLSQILGSVIPKIKQLLDADVVAIYLAEKNTEEIQLVEQIGMDEKSVQKIRRLDVRESATGIAIERGEPLFVSEGLGADAGSNSTNLDLFVNQRMRSFASIPMRSKEKILGALDVFFSKPKEFSRQDQQILLLLANQLGSVVENALLYEQISDQLKRLTTLYELSQKLTSSLELDDLCRIVHDGVITIIPFESFFIELYDGQNQTIKRVFGVDVIDGQRTILSNGAAPFREKDQSPSWKVATTKRSILENRRESVPTNSRGARMAELRLTSKMFVPMLSKDRIIGIMSVQNYSPEMYTDTHLRLLEGVANLTAIALEKAHLYQETVRKSSEIEERNKELDDFTYVVSHDLKEPLVTMEGYSNILLKDFETTFPPDGKDYLHTIADSCGRMKNLIDDLLTLSRLGRVPEISKPVCVDEVIEDIRSDLEFTIEEKNAELTVQENIPTVVCNETQIRIVFQNLISNALKFNDRPNPKIYIAYSADEDFHRFYVQDNGIGIDQRYFDKIFSIFQQLHVQEEYGGTGAGLTIVKKIIENHGGKIWVESTVGSGSTFYFTLPRELPGSEQSR